jgi:hypothetical protein
VIGGIAAELPVEAGFAGPEPGDGRRARIAYVRTVRRLDAALTRCTHKPDPRQSANSAVDGAKRPKLSA